MAEPQNTPVPGSTPIPTPRATSPVHTLPILAHPTSPLSPTKLTAFYTSAPKQRVLHLGDPIQYHPHVYAALSTQCEIIRPSTAERQRPEFLKGLKEHRWGDFHAIFRPSWGSGGEMGNWDAELVELLPESLKVVACAGAGFEWADTKLLGERGIIYCNSGLAAAEAVADFAMAMIISTFRHLPYCITSSSKPSTFDSCHRDATAQSHNLRGKTLGLIGLGNVGQQIASRARHGFGMDIHYFDIIPKPHRITNPLSAAHHATLESLLQASDCVVLCTPAGEHATINAYTLPHFRPGSRFVNIARGSLVDEDALVQALESSHISAVALDVHANEPTVHPGLLKMAVQGRAMLTCHNAGGTVETHMGFEELSMRNVMAVLGGGEAITPVNLEFVKRR